VRKRNALATRTRILDATEKVLLRDGLGRLSIDAVLAEAELSKGGFFHHFPSREALLAAVLERLSGQVAASIASALATGKPGRGSAQRAQIAFAFELPPRERQRNQALVLALLEAAQHSRAVAARAGRVTQEAVAAAVEDGLDEGDALLLQLALDGYWLGEAVGTLTLGARQRAALEAALVRLTR
jgi:AcrR family transcriptional regulator